MQLDKVGREGLISLEEGKSTVNELEITEGMGLIVVLFLVISLLIKNEWKF